MPAFLYEASGPFTALRAWESQHARRRAVFFLDSRSTLGVFRKGRVTTCPPLKASAFKLWEEIVASNIEATLLWVATRFNISDESSRDTPPYLEGHRVPCPSSAGWSTLFCATRQCRLRCTVVTSCCGLRKNAHRLHRFSRGVICPCCRSSSSSSRCPVIFALRSSPRAIPVVFSVLQPVPRSATHAFLLAMCVHLRADQFVFGNSVMSHDRFIASQRGLSGAQVGRLREC